MPRRVRFRVRGRPPGTARRSRGARKRADAHRPPADFSGNARSVRAAHAAFARRRAARRSREAHRRDSGHDAGGKSFREGSAPAPGIPSPGRKKAEIRRQAPGREKAESVEASRRSARRPLRRSAPGRPASFPPLSPRRSARPLPAAPPASPPERPRRAPPPERARRPAPAAPPAPATPSLHGWAQRAWT